MYLSNRGFAWYGGKSHLVGKLISLLPDRYNTFVEVFGGGAALLLHENKSNIRVYNDIDTDLFNLFSVIQDKNLFPSFLFNVNLILYSKLDFHYFKSIYKKVEDRVIRAAYFYFITLASVNHTTYGFARVRNRVINNMPDSVARYRSFLKRLENMHRALQGVIIENKSFEHIIPEYDAQDTLFYIDPPYISETRQKKYLYRKEMRINQHIALSDLLQTIKGKVMLSGFDHPIYDKLKWRKIEIKVCKSSTVLCSKNKRNTKKEVIWLNY